jgi:hypothetical protein
MAISLLVFSIFAIGASASGRCRISHCLSYMLWHECVAKERHACWDGVVEIPPLWSTAQIQRSGFDSRRYQILWEVVDLERGSLSLVSTIEELLGRNTSGSGLESREYGRRDPSRWRIGTLYPQRLALTSPTSDGRSVGIVRSQTQVTDFFLYGEDRINYFTFFYFSVFLLYLPNFLLHLFPLASLSCLHFLAFFPRHHFYLVSLCSFLLFFMSPLHKYALWSCKLEPSLLAGRSSATTAARGFSRMLLLLCH